MAVASKRAAAKPPTGPNAIPAATGVETWRNATEGIVVIDRIGEYGRKLQETVRGGRAFNIAPQERRNMQNLCSRPEFDMFTNGTLEPVTLVADEPDTEFLKTNPNTLADGDIPKLLRLHTDAFTARIAEINHLPTITRLLGIARDAQYSMTVPQYEVVKRREKSIRAEREGFVESDGTDTGEDAPKPVTPR